MQIINDLTPLNRVFCSSDYYKTIDYLCNILPFKIHSYTPDQEHNGWVIPPKWDFNEGKIIKDGNVIYDAADHPLKLIALSLPFEGVMARDELKKHLHYDARYKDAIPYHFRQLYRSWERDWGFCVPKSFYDSLEPGEYEVIIRTKEAEGELKVLEYTHEGKLDYTILLAAHLDHPGMANDDLSGCAVGVEVMRRLKNKKTKFSYSLLLHQEIIGAEYYLAHNRDNSILEGLFLEMLGTDTQPGLQSAPWGMTNIELFLKQAMNDAEIEYRHESYGDIVVNGEYIFAGYDIPVSSFSRYPYPEYHTSRDNPDIISEKSLEESVNLIMDAIDRLENDPLIIKNYEGNICVSNPDYDLYVDPGQPAFGSVNYDTEINKMRKLMELMPSIKYPISCGLLSELFSIDTVLFEEYIKRWDEKGLLELV